MLTFVYPNKLTNKHTNPRMDRQSDYSTPCAQARGNDVGQWSGERPTAINREVSGRTCIPNLSSRNVTIVTKWVGLLYVACPRIGILDIH